MKKLLLILCLLLSILAIGQSKHSYKRGLKFLLKSEELFKNNKFEKSLYYINKYENSVLGYCGSAKIVADKTIFDLKIKNYIGLNKFDDALILIDKKETIFAEEFQKEDSLKIEILFLKYDKDKVINSFNNVQKIETKSSELDNFIYTIRLNELNTNFKIRIPGNENYEKKIFNFDNFSNLYFITYNQPIHKLIFNKKSDEEKLKFRFIKKDGNNLEINYESNIVLSEFNKLNLKQKDVVEQYILERNPKIINATTHQMFNISIKDKNTKLLNEYSREIKVYFNYTNDSIDNYKVEVINYNEKEIPSILETLTFTKSEFETKQIELKELNIDLKEYISKIYKEIENDFLGLK